MKIAIKINFFQRTNHEIGHTARSMDAIAFNLSEELVKRGHDVTVFVTADSQTSAKIAPNAFNSENEKVKHSVEYFTGLIGKDDQRFEEYKSLFHDLWQQSYSNLLKQSSLFDLIHLQDYDESIVGSYVNAITKPVVTTLHGVGVKYKKIMPNQKFVTLSQAQKKYYPTLPILGVVYNGINVDDFDFSLKTDGYLAYLGRVTPDKGTLEAIEVAKRTGKKLVLAGGLDPRFPEYVDKVLKEIKENSRIEYLGMVGKIDKNYLLKNAYAFLMPIHWDEPFGLVAIEAMACGAPVIAFSKGALPEIIEDGKSGFLVKNVEEMCTKVNAAAMIDRSECRRRVKENFTVSKMADGYEEMYRQTLNKV